MTLEQQVVSLELAKRMKELGFPKEGLFWWVHHTAFTFEQKPKLVEGWSIIPQERLRPHSDEACFPAYTVSELGEMLPEINKTWRSDEYGWQGEAIVFDNFNVAKESKRIMDEDTEANCRAKMLIYLKENNLI